MYCIGCVMVCKIGFTKWNATIALLLASMVVTYYNKVFWTGDDRHNGILMSLLLLVAEITKLLKNHVLNICPLFRNHHHFFHNHCLENRCSLVLNQNSYFRRWDRNRKNQYMGAFCSLWCCLLIYMGLFNNYLKK